jgi:protein-tyrosine phosphatase
MIRDVSAWFRTYGFADARDELLVGAYPLDAGDVQMLARFGVRRVLNLARDDEYEPGQRDEVERALAEAGIAETRIALVDYGPLPAPELEAAVQQIVAWLEAGERTYVHCRAGWQRSAAVSAGVVAVYDGVDIEEALRRVQSRKPTAKPLPHQVDDLRRWYASRSA